MKNNNNYLNLILISCYIYLFNKLINYNYEIIILYFITLFIGYLFLDKNIVYFNLILLIIYEFFIINKEGITGSSVKKGLSKSSRKAEGNTVSGELESKANKKGNNANNAGMGKAITGKEGKDMKKEDADKLGSSDSLISSNNLDNIDV